ncbi:hypothetical protein D3C83_69300 [compost metagenome]
MLCTVTRPPSIVACGSTATSGCQSRSLEGSMVLHPATTRAKRTPNAAAAFQRRRGSRKAASAARAAAAHPHASTVRNGASR